MHKKWVGREWAKGMKNCGGNVGWCWKVVKTWDLLSASKWACCNLNKNRVGFWPKFLCVQFKFGLKVFAVVVLRALYRYEFVCAVWSRIITKLRMCCLACSCLMEVAWGECVFACKCVRFLPGWLRVSVYDLDFQTGLHFKAVVSFCSFFMEAVF